MRKRKSMRRRRDVEIDANDFWLQDSPPASDRARKGLHEKANPTATKAGPFRKTAAGQLFGQILLPCSHSGPTILAALG
jgi:hypothetical protein